MTDKTIILKYTEPVLSVDSIITVVQAPVSQEVTISIAEVAPIVTQSDANLIVQSDGYGVSSGLGLERYSYPLDDSLFLDIFAGLLGKLEIDEMGFYDIRQKGIGKLVPDPISVSEVFGLSLSKPNSEQTITTDAQTLTFEKNAIESVGYLDSYTRLLLPVYVDNVSFTDDVLGEANIDDDQTITFRKVSEDAVGMMDAFSRVVSYNLPDLNDMWSSADVLSTQYGSQQNDQYAVTDIATRLSEKRSVENLLVSEVVRLLAQIVKVDETILSEIVDRVVDKRNEDQVSNLDVLLLDVYALQLDTASVTDSLSNSITKSLSDIGILTEDFLRVIDFIRHFTDTYGTVDVAAIQAFLNKQDDFAVADINSLLIAPAYIEEITTSDANSKHLLLAHLEVLLITDDTLGEANIDDDQNMTFRKVSAEYSYMADVFARAVSYIRSFEESSTLAELFTLFHSKLLIEAVPLNDVYSFAGSKPVSETIIQTDSGYLANQDYFAEDYVIQSGSAPYVANSTRIF
jgi:hypothetical protein